MAVNDAEGLAAILIGVHMAMAWRLQAPEFALSEPEAAKLAASWLRVQRHFAIKPSPMLIDIGALAYTMVETYMPRVWNYRARTARTVNPAPSSPASANDPPVSDMSDVASPVYAAAAE